MENLIIILSMLLNIALIIAVAVYMNRFNKTNQWLDDKLTQCMRLEGDKKLLISELALIKLDVSQKDKEITDLKNKLEEQEEISDSINKQLAESYESKNKLQKEIEILSDANKNIISDNRKLSDELQEIKNKPFDPLKELDNLTIRKEEKPTPEAKPIKKRNKKETEKESARHC